MSTQNLYKKNGRHKTGKSSAILIGPGQTAYVNGRFLSESERRIADMIENCNLEPLILKNLLILKP